MIYNSFSFEYILYLIINIKIDHDLQFTIFFPLNIPYKKGLIIKIDHVLHYMFFLWILQIFHEKPLCFPHISTICRNHSTFMPKFCRKNVHFLKKAVLPCHSKKKSKKITCSHAPCPYLMKKCHSVKTTPNYGPKKSI